MTSRCPELLYSSRSRNRPTLAVHCLITQWRHQDSLWLHRTTILFQLGYKTETDERLLFALVEENQDFLEFFIQKAIGWALREYSKTAPEEVQSFVSRTALAPLSEREALKWLKAKGN